MMRARAAGKLTAFIFTFCLLMTGSVLASDENQSDLRYDEAKVVEVNEKHISVIAQTGVEHVIALDDKSTSVTIESQKVSPKEIKEGDIVTIVLDSRNPMKFARNIQIAAGAGDQLARANR